MHLARLLIDGSPRYARVDGERFQALRAGDLASAVAEKPDSPMQPLSSATLLAPVSPSKIVAVGRNYADHAKELGNDAPAEPLLFFKPPSAVLDPEGTIEMPPESSRVDFEGELAIVIGRPARRIAASQWRDVVLGFTCANDVTARDLQKKDVQFTRAKGFDTFCPLGPWIVTDLDAGELTLTTRLNGEVKQQASTRSMIFPAAHLVEYISRVMTLLPGDVILTGTPAGVGPMQPGDVVEVEIERIGTLRNRVAKSK